MSRGECDPRDSLSLGCHAHCLPADALHTSSKTLSQRKRLLACSTENTRTCSSLITGVLGLPAKEIYLKSGVLKPESKRNLQLSPSRINGVMKESSEFLSRGPCWAFQEPSSRPFQPPAGQGRGAVPSRCQGASRSFSPNSNCLWLIPPRSFRMLGRSPPHE